MLVRHLKKCSIYNQSKSYILGILQKHVFGGLYRQICAREHKIRRVFVIY